MKHLFIATLCPFFWLWLSSASLWAQGDATFTISTAPLDPAIESGIAGESITFLTTITNTGTTDAHAPILTNNILNPLPDGARIVDFVLIQGGNNFNYDVQGGECVDSGFCTLPDIPVGGFIIAKVMIEISANQNSGEDLDQHICVQAENAAQTCANYVLNIVRDANVQLTATPLLDPIAVGPTGGDQIIVLSVQNAGPSDASNTALTHTLPAGVTIATTPTIASAYANAPISCAGIQTAQL
ncbi:MAG: hypothetical protein R2911_45080 [Caldilineaceae bacterium]